MSHSEKGPKETHKSIFSRWRMRETKMGPISFFFQDTDVDRILGSKEFRFECFAYFSALKWGTYTYFCSRSRCQKGPLVAMQVNFHFLKKRKNVGNRRITFTVWRPWLRGSLPAGLRGGGEGHRGGGGEILKDQKNQNDVCCRIFPFLFLYRSNKK